ncbi:hypothetical protein KRR26_02360 [Corallococcus sp. M34]|uniref:hypothetical protein n=1 Tax=Citreicoccus inhibens TaxID=2849499 RepID=UPI001C237AF4|nr:hypothetical protein [Citreicoccus inhibens]MBU8894427.1 hypothetical protein [Citreicoccus inhibens]
MKPRPLSLLPGLLLSALVLSSTSRASPADDLIRGAGLRVNHATVTFDNHAYSATDYVIAKPAGTLNLVLKAQDFGFASDLVVHMTGARSGDTVTWDFDDWLPTPYDLGGFYSLKRVYGHLVANVELVHGTDAPSCGTALCPYNVRLRLGGGTWLRVAGSGPFWHPSFDEAVSVSTFTAFGGLPRPRLSGLTLLRPTRYCLGSAPTYFSGEVTLSTPAPTGGAWVDFTSSYGAGVSVAGLYLAQGLTRGRFDVRVAPGFEGSARLTASSGGAMASELVEMKQSPLCFKSPDWLNIKAVLCEKCLLVRGVNARGDVLGQQAGSDVVVTAQGTTLSLAKLMGAERVDGSRLNAWGQVTGTALINGTAQSFLLDTSNLKTKPTVLKPGTALGLNDVGTVVGSLTEGKTTRAFLFDGQEVRSLPLQAEWSTAVAVNNRGVVAGSYDNGKGHRAFRAYLDTAEDLGDLGGGESEARALNEQGVVVGTAKTEKGTWTAFLSRPKEGLKDLGSLSKLPFSVATAINSAGWVVGTSHDGKPDGTRRAFLYTPAEGLIDLTSRVWPDAKLTVLEALDLDDAGQVLVRAQRDGQVGFYLLAP